MRSNSLGILANEAPVVYKTNAMPPPPSDETDEHDVVTPREAVTCMTGLLVLVATSLLLIAYFVFSVSEAPSSRSSVGAMQGWECPFVVRRAHLHRSVLIAGKVPMPVAGQVPMLHHVQKRRTATKHVAPGHRRTPPHPRHRR